MIATRAEHGRRRPRTRSAARAPSKAAIDTWITAIRGEEQLASVHHTVAQVDTMGARPLPGRTWPPQSRGREGGLRARAKVTVLRHRLTRAIRPRNPVGLQQRRTRAVIRAQLRLGSSDGSALEWPARAIHRRSAFPGSLGKKVKRIRQGCAVEIRYQPSRSPRSWEQPLTNRPKGDRSASRLTVAVAGLSRFQTCLVVSGI